MIDDFRVPTFGEENLDPKVDDDPVDLVEQMRGARGTLVIEDGANPEVIEHRVTHTKAKRSAFDGYDRGAHWAETCREVAKLRLSRRSQRSSALALVR